jgi:D-amino-acid dehydrogenase
MTRHVAIIGAGIVGACCALEALREGHRVTLVDPADPGGEQAASYGNGCWLSPMSVIPPAVPGLWKKIPKFLADPLGPLAIRWSYLPRVAPWLVRYLRAGWTWPQVEDAARALRPLVVDAPALHAALAAEAGVAHLIERRGLIYIYPSRADFAAEAHAWEIRHKVGVRWIELDANDLRQREPELDRRYTFGVMVEEGGHCTDPGAYVAALVAHAVGQGAVLHRARATGFRVDAGRLRAVTTDQGEVAADAAVIAAGAHAKPLAAALGDRVPLETERGYHAQLADPEVAPRHGLMPSDGKMSIMRTATGLRCAGQVEIAGLEAAPNWKRAEILRDHLVSCFPGLPRDLPASRVKVWMGHRPSMPDGKPCLGHASATPDVIHAFGHGHTGLVAGARTGRVVAALLAGRAPEIPIAPFDPRRFA